MCIEYVHEDDDNGDDGDAHHAKINASLAFMLMILLIMQSLRHQKKDGKTKVCVVRTRLEYDEPYASDSMVEQDSDENGKMGNRASWARSANVATCSRLPLCFYICQGFHASCIMRKGSTWKICNVSFINTS